MFRRRFRETGRHFGSFLGVSDAHGAGQTSAVVYGASDHTGEILGEVVPSSEERFIPTPHLDRVPEAPQHVHDLRRGSVVRRMITRQEHCVGALAECTLHRHAGTHPVHPRLIRGRSHHLSWLSGITVATHDNRTATKFWSAADFNRCQKGIHVDVQDPPPKGLRPGHLFRLPHR